MPVPHLVTVGRTVTTRGFSRPRAALRWGLLALVAGLFVLWSLNIGHGIYAFIVLGLSAVALTLVGGPERLARTVTVSSEGVHVTRFHRVGTNVAWAELAGAEARAGTDARARPVSELVLTPRDPEVFFHRHRELRVTRQADQAVIPAGRGHETAAELTEALAHRP